MSKKKHKKSEKQGKLLLAITVMNLIIAVLSVVQKILDVVINILNLKPH